MEFINLELEIILIGPYGFSLETIAVSNKLSWLKDMRRSYMPKYLIFMG